jgi:hypothetical protein
MKKMQEKSKRKHNIQDKNEFPLKPSHSDGKYQVPNSRGQQPKTQSFSMAKEHTPPKIKANQNNRQTQKKTPTPPKVENTKFYPMS